MSATLVDSCRTCGGPVDVNEPGNVGTPGDTLEHAVCHERGEAPQTPIVDLNNGTKCCTNLQYNCGHFAYGIIDDLPLSCPECGDLPVSA